jgi:hypothetical protein
MGAGEIQREMCPNGLLRPSIRDLIHVKGSYIIATSDSAADEEYKKRVAAMMAAVASEMGHEQAEFDYYDARRLADWTNQHPGVVAWARTRLGRPLQGWQPYGQWVDTRGGKPQPFIPDEKHRLADPHEPERKFALTEGLVRVRQILRTGGSSVRLVGLSGVGKTRFAQALFEAESAPDSLPEDLAIYTDTSHSPNPTPLVVLDELLASGRRAIVVVDNCASQLHNQLTARCKASSRVSLLTIEYDIREDLPNETNVFHLETGSPELIEKVIEQQFPHISQVNVATITRFADGNSRVAIALASTMDRNDSLSGFSDRELLERLFWLGKEIQHELMIAAQACALVYSFDGEDLDGELAQLAALTDESVTTLYRRVADLESRGLAQRRGGWRAVLPHAVANTLASQALKSIPYPEIARNLIHGQDRLLLSFSRRLGYLEKSEKAIAIVRTWLLPGGLLGNIARLTPLLVEVLANVAPVDPKGTLEAIERTIQGADATTVLAPENSSRIRIARLVRSIAYEPEYFERCMDVLMAFALAEAPDNRLDPTRDLIASLFSLYLSGTHASTTQRAGWVKAKLNSSEPEVLAIGLRCLSSALECHHFTSAYGFEFGARTRDYGWSPDGREAQAWFATFIDLLADIGQGNAPVTQAARDLLASNFRALWSVAGMADALEKATIPLLEAGWEKGWLAIRQTMQFDGPGLPDEIRTRLRSLEERAKPKTLVGRVKAIVLNGYAAGVDFADGEDVSTGYEHAERVARELGVLVAADAEAFDILLPLIVCNDQGRQWMFGSGLAAGTDSIDGCWTALIAAFEAAPEEQRNVQILRGFMSGVFEKDKVLFDRLLDAAMHRASLAKWVPVLQLSAPLDDSGCARLLASMDNPNVPAWVFQYLSLGRATQKLGDNTLGQLLQRLSIKPDGLEIAIDVLSMHIFDNNRPVGPRVTELARALLASVPLSRRNHRMDHALGRLVEFFLNDIGGEASARELLLAVRNGFANYTLSKYDLTEMLKALFKVQPRAALDILVGDESEEGDTYRRRAFAGGHRTSAMASVPTEALLQWCGEGASERWTHVTPLLPAFAQGTDAAGVRWSEAVLTLLAQAPWPVDVAASLVDLIIPMSWSGSRAEAIKRRLPLLDELALVLGAEHADQIAAWRNRITKTIEREARRELDEHRASNERFE